jgi:hypothetical protein
MHPFLPSWYSEIDGVVLPKKFVFVFWVMDWNFYIFFLSRSSLSG